MSPSRRIARGAVCTQQRPVHCGGCTSAARGDARRSSSCRSRRCRCDACPACGVHAVVSLLASWQSSARALGPAAGLGFALPLAAAQRSCSPSPSAPLLVVRTYARWRASLRGRRASPPCYCLRSAMSAQWWQRRANSYPTASTWRSPRPARSEPPTVPWLQCKPNATC